MIIALLFLSLAAASLAWACKLGGLGLLLLWPGAACTLVGLAYASNRPGMLGKRSDGTLPWPAVLLYLPVLLGLWGRWHLLRGLRLEEPWVRVAPGLWLGRRPVAGELPPEAELVVDLTAEWHRAAGVRELPHRWLRCLDGMAFRDEAGLRRLLEELSEEPRGLYVHCAAGHGRSALVVAALMLRRGLADSPRAAEARLRALRPRVHITRAQFRQLEALQRIGEPLETERLPG
jgi:protein-tyrosine phosphatase